MNSSLDGIALHGWISIISWLHAHLILKNKNKTKHNTDQNRKRMPSIVPWDDDMLVILQVRSNTGNLILFQDFPGHIWWRHRAHPSPACALTGAKNSTRHNFAISNLHGEQLLIFYVIQVGVNRNCSDSLLWFTSNNAAGHLRQIMDYSGRYLYLKRWVNLLMISHLQQKTRTTWRSHLVGWCRIWGCEKALVVYNDSCCGALGEIASYCVSSLQISVSGHRELGKSFLRSFN